MSDEARWPRTHGAWAIFLNDWGAKTYSGYFTGFWGGVCHVKMDCLEDAICAAVMLRLEGRQPAEIWHDGTLVKKLAERNVRVLE